MKKNLVILFCLASWHAFAFIGGGGDSTGGTSTFANDAYHASSVDNASGTNVVIGQAQFGANMAGVYDQYVVTAINGNWTINGDGSAEFAGNGSPGFSIDNQGNADCGNLYVAGNFSVNGPFAADGSGLTNLSASSMSVNLSTNIPPSNGTNDWAVIQAAALVPNKFISFFPNQTYISSNTIYVTNGVFFQFNGSSVKYARGLTNSLFDCGVSNGAIQFWNGVIDGQEPSNYQALATIPVPPNFPEIYDSGSGLSSRGSSVRNRNGIRFSAIGGGVFSCRFRGWSGCGLLCYNNFGTSSMNQPQAQVVFCTASNNFISYFDGGGLWDGIPSYTSQANAGSFAQDSGEYMVWVGDSADTAELGLTHRLAIQSLLPVPLQIALSRLRAMLVAMGVTV